MKVPHCRPESINNYGMRNNFIRSREESEDITPRSCHTRPWLGYNFVSHEWHDKIYAYQNANPSV